MLKLGLATLLFLGTFAAAGAAEVSGVWRTESTQEGFLEIRISPCGAMICGTILRARTNAGAEAPYPHLGRQMIWDMKADGPGKWNRGKIWDPRNGKTFSSRMALSGDRLEVSGCVLGFCQGQTWQRVK